MNEKLRKNEEGKVEEVDEEKEKDLMLCLSGWKTHQMWWM
jgi:hypothetical protein